MKIIDVLLELKRVFAEQDGEVLRLVIDKKGFEALETECSRLCAHEIFGVCPTCGNCLPPNTNVLLGIVIKKEDR